MWKKQLYNNSIFWLSVLRHDPVDCVLSLINYFLIERIIIKCWLYVYYKQFNLEIYHFLSEYSRIRRPYVQHLFIINFFFTNVQNTLLCSAVDVPMESLDTLNLRVGECSFLEIALADINRYINTFVLEKKMLVPYCINPFAWETSLLNSSNNIFCFFVCVSEMLYLFSLH